MVNHHLRKTRMTRKLLKASKVSFIDGLEFEMKLRAQLEIGQIRKTLSESAGMILSSPQNHETENFRIF